LIAGSLRTRAHKHDGVLARGTLSYGARSAVVALGDAALLRLDYLLAAPIIGLAALGVYAIADQISHLMAWAGLLAGKMMLPEAASDADGRRSLAKLGLACRLMIAVLLCGSLIAAALGAWLITALFGPAFAPAYFALLILLPATLSKSLHSLIATWLQGRGVQGPVVRASAIAVAVEAVVVVIAALSLGWLGVALAKSLAYLIQLGLSLRALQIHRREHGLDDHGRLRPGGRWLLDRQDLAALKRWLDERTRRTP
jgi:O-antigen/teichoic acid export membrane protein